jgi:hypothetical protein
MLRAGRLRLNVVFPGGRRLRQGSRSRLPAAAARLSEAASLPTSGAQDLPTVDYGVALGN